MSKPEAPRPARIRLPSGGRTKFLARIPNKDVEEFKKSSPDLSMNEALIADFRAGNRRRKAGLKGEGAAVADMVAGSTTTATGQAGAETRVINRLDKKSIGARVGPKKNAKPTKTTINDEEGIG